MREVPVAFDRLVLECRVEMHSCKELSSDGRSLDQVAGWLRGQAFILEFRQSVASAEIAHRRELDLDS
jgi:hypothetical protein